MSRCLILYIVLLASYLRGAENDNFSDAMPLPGTEGSISFDLTDTTTESFEESGEGSVWYHWRAPQAGKLSVGIVPGDHDVDFRILTFAGTNPNELDRMLEKSSSEDLKSKPMGVDPGQKVFFRVSASNSIEGVLQGELRFRFEVGIPHDSRFTPIDLGEQKAVTFLADNTGATRTASENPGTFRSKSGTLWYRWTAPDDGILYLTHETLTGDIEDYGAVVTLFEGDGGTESNWLRSFTEGLGSLRYPVVEGDSFLFCYSTDEEDIPGPSALILNWTPVNEASYHGSPIVLDSDHQGEVEMTFQNALRDGSVSYQPLFRPWQSNSIRASIWYSWTAQESGTYLIKTTYGNNTLAIWTLSPAGDPIFLRKYGDDSLPFLAQQGETYLIAALSSYLPGSLLNSYFRWSFQRIEVASGDDFANRLDLGNESSWEIEESSVLTNGEEGDPILFDEDPQRSIWFTWTAPNSGDYLIDIPESSSNPTRLGIYTGNHHSNLEEVEIGTERVVFRAEKGTSYHIMIAERNANDGGDFRLTLEPAQHHINDNFASRIQLPGTRPILTDDLRYATSEPGEPGIENDSVATVWYEWKSVVSTVVWFDYNYISIYQSELENPSLADLVKMPSREFYPVFGETYYIQYRKAGPSSIGPFPTSLRSGNSTYRNFSTPITDFEFREHLPSVTNLRVGVDGSEFERQTVEGTLIDSKVTAWWSWTAPESGFYHIKNHESYLGGLTVFTGDSRDSLDVVGDCIVELFFKAEIGTTYHIAAYAELVNRPYSLLGFDLSKIELPPSNDHFLNAHDLGEEPTFSRPQESSFATVEPDEPIVDGQNPNHSVWFSYTPQFTGNYAMSVEEEEAEMNRFLTIYTGENINTLVEIEVGLDFLTTTLTAGERYFIQVASEAPMAYRLTGELIHPGFTNNNFADATIWTGASHSDFGNTLLADLEESEPLPESALS